MMQDQAGFVKPPGRKILCTFGFFCAIISTAEKQKIGVDPDMAGGETEFSEQTLSIMREMGAHMPGGFFIYRAEAPEEILYANPEVCRIFGCSGEEEFRELTGWTFRGMVHPEDYARISESISNQIRDNADHNDYAEYRIIRRDGAVRWVDDYGHYMETETYGGVYTVFISDITAKHEQMETHFAAHQATVNALQKAHAERITFNRIAQAMASDYFCLYIVDPVTDEFVEYGSSREYQELQVEKAGGDFFNLSRRNMERLIFPEDRDRFMAIFTKEKVLSILRRDGTFTTKYRLMLSGGPTYISMKATLLEDEAGCHLVIGTSNIDAQMKRELAYQERMADARNRAKNDFLANMSHDIRTPMNAIIGYTNIANSHLHDPEKVRDALAKIGSSSHFLLSLINDILDLSKIESGKMQINAGLCDLRDIFRRIEDITAMQARSKSLKITYQHRRVHHFLVSGDELRIEQVLINILSNAIKYTPEGKEVDLTAEEEPLPDGRRSLYRFIVRDTGVGISEEYLPHIFESFSREQNTTVNRIQGTGLGLSITAKIVEMMGGKISVESSVGEGSTFTVELELERLEAEEPEAAEEAEDVDLAGSRVLLVEDNDINAEIATLILEQYGIRVDRAPNGQAGVSMVQYGAPWLYDAVLMDIQMPVMNGYDASRSIRAIGGEYCRKLPIIAMSANAYDDDIRACLEAGMDAHVAKPFNPDELVKLLQKYI